MNNNELILQAKDIHKTYHLDAVLVPVLRGVDLGVKRGEFLSVVGASGSGKSTLLHILGALDKPDEGTVIFEESEIFSVNDSRRDQIRNRSFGFVFQFYHLLPELTVLENVMMPLLVGSGVGEWLSGASDMTQKVKDILNQLGLSHRISHVPAQLSGGERQRTAIARALVMQPKILFADEPTGNLDAVTGRQIFQILVELNKAGQTVIMVTHDAELARQSHRIIKLQDGKIQK
jgi:lipoprotein-releasing system ATP-binding protein